MNTKLLITIITGLLISFSLALFAYFSQPKIGYVNNQKLFAEYNAVKEGHQTFQKKMDSWQGNIDTLKSELEKEYADFKVKMVSMSPKEVEERKNELMKKKEEVLNYKTALEKQADEEEAKINQAIINQVNDYLKEYGEKHGYDYILGVTDNGSVLYAKEAKDLTDEILKGLDKKYKGKE